MSVSKIRQSIILVIVAACFFTLDSGETWSGETFRKSKLTLKTITGEHTFTIEIAETQAQHSQGLQWRKELAADAGMLFNFGEPQPTAMWMKDTFIPLDMLFIAVDGTVASIARNTKPHSLSMIRSQGPVKGVLELRAGTAARLVIRPGDRVQHAIFR